MWKTEDVLPPLLFVIWKEQWHLEGSTAFGGSRGIHAPGNNAQSDGGFSLGPFNCDPSIPSLNAGLKAILDKPLSSGE
jgi:hypothetical protein